MISITHAIRDILIRTPYIQELIHEDLINISAFARKIQKEVEEITMKEVTVESIIMSLRRLPAPALAADVQKIFRKPIEMIVRSNLVEITVSNNDFSLDKHAKVIQSIEEDERSFIIVTQGVFETTIIINSALQHKIKKILVSNKLTCFHNLSSITLKLPKEIVPTTGVYYYILRLLAWEGINVIEVASTYTEFTIILENKEIDRAFSVFKKAFIPAL